MFEVVTQAKIPAPADKIWGVLTDFDRYPEWHPWLAIKGVAAPEAPITFSLDTWGGGRILTTDGNITEFQEAVALAWVFGFGGVFVMEQRFSIDQLAAGSSLRHTIKCRGLAPLLLGWAMKQRLEHLSKTSNDALAQQLKRQQLTSRTVVAQSAGRKRKRPRKPRT